MSIEIRYQTRTGHTKTVAETMGKALSVEAKDISAPINEPVDILFIGGGVYMMNIDSSLKKFMNDLDAAKVKSIVVYSTSGHLKTAIKKLQKLAAKKGIAVRPETLLIPIHKNPTTEQLAEAETFARTIANHQPIIIA